MPYTLTLWAIKPTTQEADMFTPDMYFNDVELTYFDVEGGGHKALIDGRLPVDDFICEAVYASQYSGRKLAANMLDYVSVYDLCAYARKACAQGATALTEADIEYAAAYM